MKAIVYRTPDRRGSSVLAYDQSVLEWVRCLQAIVSEALCRSVAGSRTRDAVLPTGKGSGLCRSRY